MSNDRVGQGGDETPGEEPFQTRASATPAGGDLDATRLDPADASPVDPSPLTFIGPYQILSKIAEGGMGAVYAAQQETPIRRKVAVKVIKAGRDGASIIRRFEAERQTLAMMDHPNIARVIDAGATPDGSPFFAMELVDGVPFNQHCDAHQLSIAQRLELFIPVCEAIRHAHQKGIIHRDLKPSNVLVGMVDGRPVPKVIDFGLAKALRPDDSSTGGSLTRAAGTDGSLLTEFGAIVGTLQYMSPEQAGMDEMDIDTRTDIYSLGVMLYELLTGSPPIDKATLKNRLLLQVLEIIRETEPPRPSVRFMSSPESSASISGQRMIASRKLEQMLRGELDWIVMKAIEKQRSRRYETADAFASDIRRFLNHEPIQARPPSLAYQFSKSVRKHRALYASAAAILAVLVVSLVLISLSLVRADRLAVQRDQAAKRAIAEADNQRATTEFLFEVFGAGDPVFGNFRSTYGESIGRTTTVLSVVGSAARAEIDDATSRFLARPRLRAKILQGLADVCVTAGELQLGREALEKARSLLDETVNAADVGRIDASLGLLDYIFGDLVEGRDRLMAAQAVLRDAVDDDPGDTPSLRKLQDTRLTLGMVLIEFGDHPAAIDQFHQLASISETRTPEAPMQQVAGELFALVAEIDRRLRNDQSATPLVTEFPSILGKLVQRIQSEGFVNPSLAKTLGHALAGQIASLAKFKEVGYRQFQATHASLRDTLGDDHLLNVFPLFYLSISAQELGDDAAAIDHSSELLDLVDATIGRRNHPRLVQVLNLRGAAYHRQWRRDPAGNATSLVDAEAAYTEALAIGLPFFTADHVSMGKAFQGRGDVRLSAGDWAGAEADLIQSLASRVARHGPTSTKTIRPRRALTHVLELERKLADLQPQLRDLLSIIEIATPDNPVDIGQIKFRLAKSILGVDATATDDADIAEVRELLIDAIEKMTVEATDNAASIREATEMLETLSVSRFPKRSALRNLAKRGRLTARPRWSQDGWDQKVTVGGFRGHRNGDVDG